MCAKLDDLFQMSRFCKHVGGKEFRRNAVALTLTPHFRPLTSFFHIPRTVADQPKLMVPDRGIIACRANILSVFNNVLRDLHRRLVPGLRPAS